MYLHVGLCTEVCVLKFMYLHVGLCTEVCVLKFMYCSLCTEVYVLKHRVVVCVYL